MHTSQQYYADWAKHLQAQGFSIPLVIDTLCLQLAQRDRDIDQYETIIAELKGCDRDTVVELLDGHPFP